MIIITIHYSSFIIIVSIITTFEISGEWRRERQCFRHCCFANAGQSAQFRNFCMVNKIVVLFCRLQSANDLLLSVAENEELPSAVLGSTHEGLGMLGMELIFN